jgi:RNA polymerase sigma factor (sigma-70 family)
MNSKNAYLVDNDEILALVDSWRAASQPEKNRLANRLVSRLAFLIHARIKFHKGSHLYDDLLQEGRLGIMRALQKFEPERSRNFFMFATWHIQMRVRRLLRREARRNEIPSGDMLASGNPEESLDGIEVSETRDAIVGALGLLPNRDRKVLVMRFGFDGDGSRTLRLIGEEFGVTRQRAQQIEAQGLRRLRGNQKFMDLVG